MKRISKLLCLVISLFMLSGCFKRDNMEGINIITSVYPIEYIVDTLYGNYANISSIYPSGVDVYTYELTEKQIEDYSKADLFVYNGLSDEKQIARNFINKNKNMKIIDVSYGLNIEYGNTPEELWLSPNNFLMLATTIKNNLCDFISSKYIIEEINRNYNDLQEKVSILDANLRAVGYAASSKEQETIIVSSNIFKFLENYGFKVISLEDSDTNIESIKDNFKNGNYKNLFIKKNESSDIITELKDKYKANVIEINLMNVLDETGKENNNDYLYIMNKFLTTISDATLA